LDSLISFFGQDSVQSKKKCSLLKLYKIGKTQVEQDMQKLEKGYFKHVMAKLLSTSGHVLLCAVFTKPRHAEQ